MATSLFGRNWVPMRWYWLSLGLGVLLSVVLFFSFGIFMGTRERLLMRCDGIVVDKYISKNHQSRRVVVRGEEEVVLEGLSDEFWNSVNIGDHVVKVEKNPFVLLNGNSVPMLLCNEFDGRKGKYLAKSAQDEFRKP